MQHCSSSVNPYFPVPRNVYTRWDRERRFIMLPTDASAPWFEIQGRLFRFFGTHAGWARWHDAADGTWICGQERDRAQDLVRATRVAAVVHDPRLIPSRSMPEHHAFADLTAAEWNRLLLGIFTYLGGPAHLADITTVAAVLLRLPATAAPPPDLAAGHLRCEDMDGIVENTLDDAAQDRAALHTLDCAFCAGQLASYRGAAERMAAPLHRPAAS